MSQRDDQTEAEWRKWLENFEREFYETRRRTMNTVGEMMRDTARERAAIEERYRTAAERAAQSATQLSVAVHQMSKTITTRTVTMGRHVVVRSKVESVYAGIGDTSLVKAPETCKDYPLVCYHLNGSDREARRARRAARHRRARHVLHGASLGSILALVVFYTAMPLFVAVPIAMVLWSVYWQDKPTVDLPPIPEARLLPKDTPP